MTKQGSTTRVARDLVHEWHVAATHLDRALTAHFDQDGKLAARAPMPLAELRSDVEELARIALGEHEPAAANYAYSVGGNGTTANPGLNIRLHNLGYAYLLATDEHHPVVMAMLQVGVEGWSDHQDLRPEELFLAQVWELIRAIGGPTSPFVSVRMTLAREARLGHRTFESVWDVVDAIESVAALDETLT